MLPVLAERGWTLRYGGTLVAVVMIMEWAPA
jgi:hypothetical protein